MRELFDHMSNGDKAADWMKRHFAKLLELRQEADAIAAMGKFEKGWSTVEGVSDAQLRFMTASHAMFMAFYAWVDAYNDVVDCANSASLDASYVEESGS